MKWEEMYDILNEVVGVSTEALDLAFGLMGCNEETGEKILFYYTGWRSFQSYLAEVGGNWE